MPDQRLVVEPSREADPAIEVVLASEPLQPAKFLPLAADDAADVPGRRRGERLEQQAGPLQRRQP
ncbi:hypothetical protein D3C83_257980 [compost metagenome]